VERLELGELVREIEEEAEREAREGEEEEEKEEEEVGAEVAVAALKLEVTVDVTLVDHVSVTVEDMVAALEAEAIGVDDKLVELEIVEVGEWERVPVEDMDCEVQPERLCRDVVAETVLDEERDNMEAEEEMVASEVGDGQEPEALAEALLIVVTVRELELENEG